MIEIEKRGLLSLEKYNELLSFLDKSAESLGEDDKDVVYYIYPDKLLKVVHNLSKKNAKVSLKMNKLGDGASTLETEVVFISEDFKNMKYILDVVGQAPQTIEGNQKRRNYIYKDCEIAVKWSKDYGYHFEIEKVTENKNNIEKMEKEIESIAEDLDVVLMTNEEIKQLQIKIESEALKK